MEELNRKLAEWIGIKDVVIEACYLTGYFTPAELYDEERLFTSSLDACFKWLVPVFENGIWTYWSLHKKRNGLYEFEITKGPIQAGGYTFIGQAETPALAVCKAFDKLIDNDKQKD